MKRHNFMLLVADEIWKRVPELSMEIHTGEEMGWTKDQICSLQIQTKLARWCFSGMFDWEDERPVGPDGEASRYHRTWSFTCHLLEPRGKGFVGGDMKFFKLKSIENCKDPVACAEAILRKLATYETRLMLTPPSRRSQARMS